MQLPARIRDVEMVGERLMAAPREAVWVALNDPEILRRCLPRCDRVERISDVEFSVAAGVFAGALRLSEVDPPNGYVFEAELIGEGSEQPARVRGRLDLASGGDGTRVRYVVDAQAGGVRARPDRGPAGEGGRALVEEAFACLEKALAEVQPAPVAVAAHPSTEPLADEARAGLRPGLWVPTLMLIVALILYAAN